MNKAVIFLNGPSGIGKDTIAGKIQKATPRPVLINRFSQPLETSVQTLTGLTDDLFAHWRNKAKECPCIPIGGTTSIGALMRATSEVVRDSLPEGHLGKLCAERIEASDYPVHIVADTGFIDEYLACIKALNKGTKTTLVRLQPFPHRDDVYRQSLEDYADDVFTAGPSDTEQQSVVVYALRWLDEKGFM